MRSRVVPVVVVALLAVQACAAGQQPAPAGHPPAVGRPVVLDARVPGWETTAWLTESAFCVHAARVGKHEQGRENESVFCEPTPSALDISGPPLLPAKPLPYLAPLDPQSRELLLVGAVRGAVASVSVIMFDRTATAPVRPLPAPAGRKIGAYAVWLPRSGAQGAGMKSADITAVIGRDSAGRIVTELT